MLTCKTTPDYWKSLLKVTVPVRVILAKKKMTVDEILDLVPGIMIQFDKPCDSPLTVEVDGQVLANGEVVKVGDKFGVRIKEVVRSAERYIPVWPNQPEKSDS
jgi:flagellar motor switch protein FliN/FliY